MGDTTVHTDGMSYRDIEDGRLRDLAIHDGAFRPEGAPPTCRCPTKWRPVPAIGSMPIGPPIATPFRSAIISSWSRTPRSRRSDLNCIFSICAGTGSPSTPIRTWGPTIRCVCGPVRCLPPAPSAIGSTTWTVRIASGVASWSPTSSVVCRRLRGRRYLQIMEQLPKTQQFARRAYDQSPVMGYGTYYAKRCWGRVPIESDGSAHFELPALREVYLQVLDAEGRELQRQTSSLQVMPGEVRSCIGCHEPRGMAPAASARLPLAARRPADSSRSARLDR